MPVTFPYNAKLQSVDFQLVGSSSSGGQSISGAMTRVASNSAHWVAQASFVIYGHDAHVGWSGFVAAMQGVLGETEVPAWARIMPFDRDGQKLSRVDAVDINANGSAFDNTGLEQTEITHARLKNAAALRDTVIQVEYVNTTGIRPGHRIGLGDRCYDVIGSYGDTDGETTLQIAPPLRSDHPANERVILDRPKCLMRFETETEGRAPFTVSPVNVVTVNFREVV